MQHRKDCSLKLVLLGSSTVGKTSIVHRAVGKGFDPLGTDSTIGASFCVKHMTDIDTDKKFRLDIWDTAGQERYHSLAPMYYRNAAVAIIVYDITCQDSFQQSIKWIDELIKHTQPIPFILWVGNKHDLEESKKVVVGKHIEDVMYSLGKENVIWLETSAKTGYNIDKLFDYIASWAAENSERFEQKEKPHILRYHPSSKTSKCCYF